MTLFTNKNLSTGICVPAPVTEDPDELEEDDDSADDEADDNGRVYKNPRNFPSPGKNELFLLNLELFLK